MIGSSKNSLGYALDWYQKKVSITLSLIDTVLPPQSGFMPWIFHELMNHAFQWRQLGSYDQQLWEKSIEERVLKGINHAVPKKLAKPNSGLIDLDLIRGSAFTKAKPQQGCIATTYLGVVRVLLLPFYIKWWTDQTNSHICALLISLYSLQLSSMYFYFNSDLRSSTKEFEEIPESEVLVPVIMMLILSVIQSHIAASHSLDERNRSRDRECSTCTSSTRTTIPRVISFVPVVRRKRRSPSKRSAGRQKVTIVEKENSPPPIVPDVEMKKASDEESGLESLDMKMDSNRKLSERRMFTPPKVVILEVVSDDSSSPKNSPSRPLSRTGEEGDHEGDACELSSPEEISPYSTINSTADLKWRRYSDIVSKRLRSYSNSAAERRYSNLDEVRTRSSTITKCCVVPRNSPDRSSQISHTSRKDSPVNSSCESEGSLSPHTPTKGVVTDAEWPLINTEGSSEEEDYDEAPQPPLEEEIATRRASFDYTSYLKDEELFSGDPDSLPPQIFSFCDDWIPTGRSADSKKTSDKGKDSSWFPDQILIQFSNQANVSHERTFH